MRALPDLLSRARQVLSRPPPRLPRPIDRLAERWAGLTPRVRALAWLALIVVVVTSCEARLRVEAARWGGAPVTVLVATEDLPAGAPAEGLRARRLPPNTVPSDAVATAPSGARLAYALPAGSVLTQAHLDDRGPAAGLAPRLRAVPVPVEDGWGVVPGGWVDVWVLGGEDGGPQLVGRSRPVVDVRDDDGYEATALVGLARDEVTAVTAGLSHRAVLLVHAPPPSPGEQPPRRPDPSDE